MFTCSSASARSVLCSGRGIPLYFTYMYILNVHVSRDHYARLGNRNWRPPPPLRPTVATTDDTTFVGRSPPSPRRWTPKHRQRHAQFHRLYRIFYAYMNRKRTIAEHLSFCLVFVRKRIARHSAVTMFTPLVLPLVFISRCLQRASTNPRPGLHCCCVVCRCGDPTPETQRGIHVNGLCA